MDLQEGRVSANGLDFAYVEAGAGPLALCLHGFPDSPLTYRHLLPALADAGFRAVAPFMRGYAPTAVPADGNYRLAEFVADATGLHEALGGGADAVLVGHDWGALTAWGAAAQAPERFRRAAIIDIPPLAVVGPMFGSPAQIQRMFYMWFFQQSVADAVVAANDLAFLDYLWSQWSPGFDAGADLVAAKRALADPANLGAALGYYRTMVDPSRYGTEEWVAENGATWGVLPTQPVLYLHGTRDGFLPLGDEHLAQIAALLGKDSEVAFIPDAGHFLLVEAPAAANDRIVRFLAAS